MVGLLDDIRHATTQWFKQAGDVILLLGERHGELGGSEYLKVIHGLEAGLPPRVDLALERAVQQVCLQAIRAGLVGSAHDVSDGGLAVALAECCMTGPGAALGATVTLDGTIRPDALLFGEVASCILLGVRPEAAAEVQAMAQAQGVPCTVLGRVEGADLTICGNDFNLSVPVTRLQETWATGLSRLLG